jgi:hypothetical protein
METEPETYSHEDPSITEVFLEATGLDTSIVADPTVDVREFVLSFLPDLRREEILKPGEIASMLHVSTKEIGRWTNAGLLNHFRTLGNHRRIYFGHLVDALVVINSKKEYQDELLLARQVLQTDTDTERR